MDQDGIWLVYTKNSKLKKSGIAGSMTAGKKAVANWEDRNA